MLNDREDKYDNDDSEYHFTDEDVSYEVETESPKASASSGANASVAAVLNRLAQSKRILISAGVFVVLIFLVYKMVAPSSPKVDIPAPVLAQQNNPGTAPQNASPMQANMPQATTAPNPAANPMLAQQPPTTPPMPAPTEQSMTSVNPQPVAELPQQSQPMPSQEQLSSGPQPTMTPPPVAGSEAPASGMNAESAQPAVMVQQTMPEQTPENKAAITMPPVMPVQSAVPAQPYETPAQQPSRMEQIVNENEKMMTQLQADYSQKASEYAAQNKELQDQMQTLNTRVASMESQMSQLVQALTKQTQGANQSNASQSSAPANDAQPNQAANDAPVSRYSVQAIIPGRAWLRSDSGEAVTVAEGDTIKELGKVTKIDPYDGVVEINTGSKVISLSYGNGS